MASTPPGEARALIFNEIRLPRAVLGALVGGALGLSGAALQGYLRNPLAEPSLVGVSGGAALGAVLAIHLGLSQAFALALPLGGLAGAAVAMLAVVALAGAHGGPVTLILAGLAVSSIATALVSLALNLSQNPFAAVEMVFWMMGSLADRSLTQLWISAPLIAGRHRAAADRGTRARCPDAGRGCGRAASASILAARGLP